MSEAAQTMNPASVAADILADAPKADTTAKPPASAPVPESAPKPETGKRDIIHNGKAYDPDHYRLKPDGSLFLNKYGNPMPKGGRKPKAATAPAPETSVWSETDRAAAAAPVQPETGNGETGNGQPQTVEPEVITPAATRRAAARAGTRLLYTATGVVTGNPEDATPPVKEDKELQETAAYIFEASGWNPGPKIALTIMVITYLLYVGSRPKNLAVLSNWWRGFIGNGNAAAPATATTATAAPTAPRPAMNARGETLITPQPPSRL
jgi:hypothetical protein